MESEYQWKVASAAPAEFIEKFAELQPIVAQLLYNRGLRKQEDIDCFLMPDYGDDQHDPFAFKDMRIAIDRIKKAVENEEKIVVHGDYDADGVCGSVVMYKTLQEIGADVEVYLPHRDTEGYGLNMNTVQSLHDIGTSLIITVDCGISNKEEIAKAVELGMDVIVTDHHSEPTELPTQALAVINAKVSGETYPFRDLAGVGVSFKVCQALVKEYDLGEGFEKWMLDLVAISTVTDFVPLVGENRVLVKYGLVVLSKNRRPGLQQLFSILKLNPQSVTTDTISFQLGPHINAAGRVKHANMAFEMLIEDDNNQAHEAAEALRATNVERQNISDRMSRQALKQAEEQKDRYVIIVESDDWPVGLIGLVAGKVSDKFNRPVFVITKMGNEIMGSGRSIEHFDLVAGLQDMDELFTKYGGHPMACGFSFKNEKAREDFETRMRQRAKDLLENKDLRKTLKIELELNFDQVNWELIDILEQLAPYGESNPEPIFVSRDVQVETFSCVGKTKSHLRLTLSNGSVQRKCIGFGFGEWAQKLTFGDKVDLVYTVSVNEWNGNREIQLEIKDIILKS